MIGVKDKTNDFTINATKVATEDGPAMVSYWELTAAERTVLASGGRIALWVWGSSHPRMAVEVAPGVPADPPPIPVDGSPAAPAEGSPT